MFSSYIIAGNKCKISITYQDIRGSRKAKKLSFCLIQDEYTGCLELNLFPKAHFFHSRFCYSNKHILRFPHHLSVFDDILTDAQRKQKRSATKPFKHSS